MNSCFASKRLNGVQNGLVTQNIQKLTFTFFFTYRIYSLYSFNTAKYLQYHFSRMEELVHDTLFITHEGILSRTWVFKDEFKVPIYKRVLRGLFNTNETIIDATTNQVLASYKGGFLDPNGTITLYGLDGKETKTINVEFTSEGLTRLIHWFDYKGERFSWMQDKGIKNAICHIDLPNHPQYKSATVARFNDIGTLRLITTMIPLKSTRELEILLVMTMCIFYNSIEPYKDSLSRMVAYQHM